MTATTSHVPRVVASTDTLSREDWLELRRFGIGGSDAGAICGFNPWKSALGVYFDKTGEVEPEEAGEAADWGNILEDPVAQEFARREELVIQKRPVMLQHPEHDWMLANVDRFVLGEHGQDAGIVEVKVSQITDEWEDGVPERHLLQVQHYLAVTGLPMAWVVVLLRGARLDSRLVERDDEAIAALIEMEAEFWEGVQSGTPPPVDFLDATSDVIKRRFPNAVIRTVDLPVEALELVERRQLAVAAEKEAAQEKARAENALKLLLGEADVGAFEREPIVTWKPAGVSNFDIERFRGDHPDLAEQYTNRGTTRRIGFPKRKAVAA